MNTDILYFQLWNLSSCVTKESYKNPTYVLRTIREKLVYVFKDEFPLYRLPYLYLFTLLTRGKNEQNIHLQ